MPKEKRMKEEKEKSKTEETEKMREEEEQKNAMETRVAVEADGEKIFRFSRKEQFELANEILSHYKNSSNDLTKLLESIRFQDTKVEIRIVLNDNNIIDSKKSISNIITMINAQMRKRHDDPSFTRNYEET